MIFLGQKISQLAKKRSTKYFGSQKISVHQHRRASSHGWEISILILAQMPSCQNFGATGLSIRPAQWMDLFQLGLHSYTLLTWFHQKKYTFTVNALNASQCMIAMFAFQWHHERDKWQQGLSLSRCRYWSLLGSHWETKAEHKFFTPGFYPNLHVLHAQMSSFIHFTHLVSPE